VDFTEEPGVDEHPTERNPAGPDRRRRRPIDMGQIDADDAVLDEVPLGREEKNLPRIPGIVAGGGSQIAGSGDILFKGHAVNPKVEIMGSGSVTVGSYEGNLDKDIAGSGDFKVLGTVGAPSVPPAPPAH
jgi:hypothetical protein